MVNDHYQLSLLNGYNWEYTLFSDKPIFRMDGFTKDWPGGFTMSKNGVLLSFYVFLPPEKNVVDFHAFDQSFLLVGFIKNTCVFGRGSQVEQWI